PGPPPAGSTRDPRPRRPRPAPRRRAGGHLLFEDVPPVVRPGSDRLLAGDAGRVGSDPGPDPAGDAVCLRVLQQPAAGEEGRGPTRDPGPDLRPAGRRGPATAERDPGRQSPRRGPAPPTRRARVDPDRDRP